MPVVSLNENGMIVTQLKILLINGTNDQSRSIRKPSHASPPAKIRSGAAKSIVRFRAGCVVGLGRDW